MKQKQIELLALVTWVLPAYYLCIFFGPNYIVTIAILFGLPALYMSFRKPQVVRKLLIYSLIIAISGVATVSYLAHQDLSWFNPSYFPRIFGAYAVEDFVWGFIYVYAITMAYEYFFERDRSVKFPPRFKKIAISLLLLTFVFSFVAYVYPKYLLIPYFYSLFVLIFFIIQPWGFLFINQALIAKVIKMEILFLVPSLVFEYLAVVRGEWFFPGAHYIGHVVISGITIPLEEFLWLLLAIPAFIVYYEAFADDMK